MSKIINLNKKKLDKKRRTKEKSSRTSNQLAPSSIPNPRPTPHSSNSTILPPHLNPIPLNSKLISSVVFRDSSFLVNKVLPELNESEDFTQAFIKQASTINSTSNVVIANVRPVELLGREPIMSQGTVVLKTTSMLSDDLIKRSVELLRQELKIRRDQQRHKKN